MLVSAVLMIAGPSRNGTPILIRPATPSDWRKRGLGRTQLDEDALGVLEEALAQRA